jgi:predicted enzyme related to lactoylglutathione lyase
MAERTKYSNGVFSWADLSTTDEDGAKQFYGALFGWQPDDAQVGEGYSYSLMKLEGKDVAAVSSQPEQQREAGVPPTWNSYITVDSADDTLARAKELGAAVHADAFDVLDVGRMGVVQDPQGAFFLIWEPKAHIGASLINVPGALTWNELASPDVDASAGFYGDLFGWSVEEMEGGPFRYLVIKTPDGRSNGGIRPQMPEEPPYWLVYFGTEDVEGTVTRGEELGGSTLAGAMSIGPGKIAIVQDAQGAVFALYEGEFDD